MFDADAVREILSLKAERSKLLGSSGLSIGFAGSPEWVLGGALIAGVLQSVSASGTMKQAQELQVKILKKEAELRASGRFFDFRSISGMSEADPFSWSAFEKIILREKRRVSPGHQSYTGRQNYISRLMEIEVDQETEREVEKSYIVRPDDFICVRSSIGVMDFRWSQVVAFRPTQ